MLSLPVSPDRQLWMGSHPSVPSYVKPSGPVPAPGDRVPLGAYLRSHPALLSNGVIRRFGIDVQGSTSSSTPSSSSPGETTRSVLPFLFKILSVGKALSIQAHPDKALAQRLHRQYPEIYKDDNHKPEMAVALTEFHGFCGFRPLIQIYTFLQNVPELRQLICQVLRREEDELLEYVAQASAHAEVPEHKEALRTLFEAVMTAPSQLVHQTIAHLLERYASHDPRLRACEVSETPSVVQEVQTLHSQFPFDVGILCAFLLNHVQLNPGQALFLGANEPHAYLSGEIAECMSASDNVVRAGLTPKMRDTSTLVQMLTYDDTPPEQKRMTPSPWVGSGSWSRSQAQSRSHTPGGKAKGRAETMLYQPPIDEFRVLRTVLSSAPSTESSEPLEAQCAAGYVEEHAPLAGPSVIIVTQGNAQLIFDRSFDAPSLPDDLCGPTSAVLGEPERDGKSMSEGGRDARKEDRAGDQRGKNNATTTVLELPEGAVAFVAPNKRIWIRSLHSNTTGDTAGNRPSCHSGPDIPDDASHPLVVFRAFVEVPEKPGTRE